MRGASFERQRCSLTAAASRGVGAGRIRLSASPQAFDLPPSMRGVGRDAVPALDVGSTYYTIESARSRQRNYGQGGWVSQAMESRRACGDWRITATWCSWIQPMVQAQACIWASCEPRIAPNGLAQR